MSTTNIGQDSIDLFYRYKRPCAICEYRGGKTTIISNLEDIAKALHTKPFYIIYYIQLAKSTSVTTKGEIKMVISLVEIESLINQFIDEYVLCIVCHLPELVIKKSGKDLEFNCEACGHATRLAKNKFTKAIYKDYQ